MRRLKKKKYSSGLVKSLKSETDDGLLSCSSFPERPTLEELERDKPVLPEIEHSKGKVTDEQLEAIKDVLDRHEDVFSKHNADIGCCNFVEHEIELEESAVPHREGARHTTPNKSDACRKEIETLLEYDMIEPSKSTWACGVVMAKKKGDQLRFRCVFRYLNSVTVKDVYPIPSIDQSPSKIMDAKFCTTLDLGSVLWQVPLKKQDRDKTGFACELGMFQRKRMPFGLCNATATFQRLTAHALTSRSCVDLEITENGKSTEEEKLSRESDEWDEDSEKSSNDQDSLCMILAEEKMRFCDREQGSQTSIKYSPNQGGNSRTVKSGGEAA